MTQCNQMFVKFIKIYPAINSKSYENHSFPASERVYTGMAQ